MISANEEMHVFRLGRRQYIRTRLLAWLLICASLALAVGTAILGTRLFPAYTHEFTLYLKWQDALLATLWYCSFILVWSSVLVARFLFALRAGYRESMFTLQEESHSSLGSVPSSVTIRDVSPKNLSSIYWMVGTALSCFLACLVGLVPEILIGWTLHLPHPALVFFGTLAAVLLSLAGLAVTLVSCSFIIIGFTGSFSFSRKMGAAHKYQLTSQTILRVDGPVLTAIYPDKPETLLDLTLLDAQDRNALLSLLRQRWQGTEHSWNLLLSQEIEHLLQQEQHATLV